MIKTPFFLKSLFYSLLLLIPLSTLWGQSADNLESRIDSVVSGAIQQRAFPGCVVYAAHKGKPFFLKAYGHHTYDSLIPTQIGSIYDLASLTKVTAAGLCLMKLYEEGKIRLDDPLSLHVRGLNDTVGALTLRELMTHQSGLPPGFAFHRRILPEESSSARLDALQRRRYKKMKDILNNEVSALGVKQFTYSDLFFLLVPELVEEASGETYEDYLNNHFYQSLGASTLVFNAGQTFPLSRIAPTEYDSLYHGHLIHGKVHDESAALMGGVSGNAGLFGSAQDVARVWQMILNKGEYNGVEYLRPETVVRFTRRHFVHTPNHRGLVFDRPPLLYDSLKSQIAAASSAWSYGHTGFTGTMVWADPENDLLFIFLSNRVHPSRTPNRLNELRVRPVLHAYFMAFLNSKNGVNYLK